MAGLTDKQKQDLLDRKPKPGSGPVEILKFVLHVVFSVPAFIVLGLPTLLVFKLIKILKGKRKFRKPQYLEYEEPAKDRKAPQDRQYDIVVYGASGYTGKLVAQYIAKHHDNLKWAIAGRSQVKLQQIRSQLAKSNPQLEQLPILIADSADEQALKTIINNTRVIISTVGPFSLYGNFVVGLCAAYGTHYIDSTGEVAWIREMIIRYDSLAVKSGAQLISSCGLDSIPWDVITYNMHKQMNAQHNQKLKKIECFDEMQQAFSGGTFATLQVSFLNPAQKTRTDFDPLLKMLGSNEKSLFGQKTRCQAFMGYGSKIKRWIGMWGLAQGNAGIVRRSNALIGYNEQFSYYEALQYQNFFAAFNDQMYLAFLQFLLEVPPLLGLLNKLNVFPQPGQGQGEDYFEQGYLVLRAFGTGENGAKLKGTLTLPNDPGYFDTARMLAESGLCLLQNQSEIKERGGFLTPALIGEPLTRRMVETGSILRFE